MGVASSLHGSNLDKLGFELENLPDDPFNFNFCAVQNSEIWTLNCSAILYIVTVRYAVSPVRALKCEKFKNFK